MIVPSDVSLHASDGQTCALETIRHLSVLVVAAAVVVAVLHGVVRGSVAKLYVGGGWGGEEGWASRDGGTIN